MPIQEVAMVKQLFYYLSHYANLKFTWFALPVLLVGIYCAALGFYIYDKKNAGISVRRYLLFSLCLSLYLVGASFAYMSRDPESGLFWAVVANVGTIYLPHAILSTTGVLLGDSPSLQRWRRILFIISTLFAVSLLGGHHFILEVKLKYWGYFPVYGSMGYLYLIYFALVMAVVLINFLLEYHGSSDMMQRQRMIISSAAMSIGLFGAVDFLPAIGFSIYAFGYIPMGIYMTLMGYAILRYRLVDISSEIVAAPVLDTMRGAVIVADRSGFIRLANRFAHRILQLESPKLLNQNRQVVPWLKELDPDNPELRSDGGLEVSWTDSSGAGHTVLVRASDLRDSPRNIVGTVFVAQDISDLKNAEYLLKQIAVHDTLTGLPNRAFFMDYLGSVLEMSRRNSGRFALLFLDLNNFKTINDTMGHEAGDRVLRICSQRIRSAIRSSDTVARMGGDEFVVLCSNMENAEAARNVAEKILGYVGTSLALGDEQIHPGVSIGVSLFPDHGSSADNLLAAADTAMYEAKKGGLGVVLYKPGIQ